MKPVKFTKFTVVLIVLLVVAGTAGVWFLLWSGRSKKGMCNVILISIDTCRADYLGCYGYPRQTTPNIDRFATDSILFSNVIAPAPVTLPSHSSMLTGSIPPYHGVRMNNTYILPKANLTLAEILRSNGLATAAIVSTFVLDSQFGLNQGFDTYYDRFEENPHSVFYNERRAEDTSRLAIEWLQKSKEKKFFLFLHYWDPHLAYQPPEPFASRFADNLYAGEIAYTDHCIGQVIEKLKELGLYESSMIIITADHGEMLGEHGEESHLYFIYQSAIKVPLLFKLPGRSKHKKIDAPASLIDIVPTVCSFLGLKRPPKIQGEDLSPYFYRGKPADTKRRIYCESIAPSAYKANPLFGVLAGRWKYIQTTRPELYDVVEDPGETNNLIEQHVQRGLILKDYLQQILAQATYKDSKITLDELSLKRLESLGYIAGDARRDYEFDQNRPDAKDLLGLHNAVTKSSRLITKKKEFEQAKNICQKWISQYPDSPHLHKVLAEIATFEHDLEGQVFHLSKSLEFGAGVYSNLGAALVQLGRFDEAVSRLKKALELNPQLAQAHNNLGFTFKRQGKFDQAITHSRKALELDPELVQAHNNLGLIFNQQGEFTTAVIHFEEVLRINPDYPGVHKNLADALFQQSSFTKAVTHYKKALQINPDLVSVHAKLAYALEVLGRFDQAVEHYTEAIRTEPNCPEFLNNLVWLLATHKNAKFHNPKEAVRLAERACQLTKYEDPDLLDTLATAYAATGNFSDAVKTSEMALEQAQSANQHKLAAQIQKRLQLFKSGQPYHEP